jgi:hypothetical protein
VFTNSSPAFDFLVDPSTALWYCKTLKSKKLLEETTPFWPASVFLLRWQTE